MRASTEQLHEQHAGGVGNIGYIFPGNARWAGLRAQAVHKTVRSTTTAIAGT